MYHPTSHLRSQFLKVYSVSAEDRYSDDSTGPHDATGADETKRRLLMGDGGKDSEYIIMVSSLQVTIKFHNIILYHLVSSYHTVSSRIIISYHHPEL